MIDWFEPVVGQLPDLWAGLITTIQLVAITSITSIAFALVLAVLRLNRSRFIRGAALVIIDIFRSVPLVAQLVIAFFVIGKYFPNVNPFWITVLILTVCEAAYVAEVYRAAITAVSASQWDAATSLGMTTWQRYRYVVVPQAILPCIPPTVNLLIWIIKGSALGSLIGTRELVFTANGAIDVTFAVMPIYVFVLGVYLLMTIPLAYIARWLENYGAERLGARKFA